jgi:hypothetical protein
MKANSAVENGNARSISGYPFSVVDCSESASAAQGRWYNQKVKQDTTNDPMMDVQTHRGNPKMMWPATD